METKEFKISGMTCGGCERTVAAALTMVKGVAQTKADHRAGTVVVTFDPAATSAERIGKAIEQAGYDLVG